MGTPIFQTPKETCGSRGCQKPLGPKTYPTRSLRSSAFPECACQTPPPKEHRFVNHNTVAGGSNAPPPCEFALRSCLSLSISLSSLHFTSPGKSPRKWTRAQAPLPPSSVEEEQRLDTLVPPPFQSEATKTQDVQVTKTDGFPSRSTTLGKSLQQCTSV